MVVVLLLGQSIDFSAIYHFQFHSQHLTDGLRVWDIKPDTDGTSHAGWHTGFKK